MMSKDEAMEKAFKELMNMDDIYFEEKLKEAMANPGVFQKNGINGFYTDSYDFIEMGKVCVVWELPNENS